MADQRGRPPKLTPELQENIIHYLRFGNFLETAAAFNGVDRTTLWRWITRGKREIQRLEANLSSKIKQSEVPYVDFCNAVERADVESEIRYAQLCYAAAKDDPNFAYKMLMSGRYKKWRNNGTQETQNANEQIGSITTEDIEKAREKLIRRLEKMQGIPDDLEPIGPDGGIEL
jgi:hypothetical protein